MASITPAWDPAHSLTCLAEDAITCGRFVAVSGPQVNGNPTVGLAGASATGLTGTVVGVAVEDAALGATLTVATRGIWPMTAGGTISAGDKVKGDSTGRATATTAVGVCHGYAISDATVGLEVLVMVTPNTAIAV
jgi:hypothetical protein